MKIEVTHDMAALFISKMDEIYDFDAYEVGKALEAVFELIEDEDGLQAEIAILVEQIYFCKDLAKLKEMTKKNFPEEWADNELCDMNVKKNPVLETKHYDLSKMWKVWYKDYCSLLDMYEFSYIMVKDKPKDLAAINNSQASSYDKRGLGFSREVIAITPATATSFYEGEGL